jgi:hypothetical protein
MLLSVIFYSKLEYATNLIPSKSREWHGNRNSIKCLRIFLLFDFVRKRFYSICKLYNLRALLTYLQGSNVIRNLIQHLIITSTTRFQRKQFMQPKSIIDCWCVSVE